jgi:hypothetical protein
VPLTFALEIGPHHNGITSIIPRLPFLQQTFKDLSLWSVKSVLASSELNIMIRNSYCLQIRTRTLRALKMDRIYANFSAFPLLLLFEQQARWDVLQCSYPICSEREAETSGLAAYNCLQKAARRLKSRFRGRPE